MSTVVPHAETPRPHLLRGVLAGVVMLGGLVASSYGDLRADGVEPLVTVVSTLLVLFAGVVGVRAFARAARIASERRIGDERGTAINFLVLVVGYFLLVLLVLDALGQNPSTLLLGGAITGVVLGIAAQQTLANFFAGIVLLIVRPIQVGQETLLRSGPLGGEYEGRIVDMSLFYVHMHTANGPVQLPNSGVLMSAIGPGARAPKEEEEEEDKKEGDRQMPKGAGGAPDHSKGTAS